MRRPRPVGLLLLRRQRRRLSLRSRAGGLPPAGDVLFPRSRGKDELKLQAPPSGHTLKDTQMSYRIVKDILAMFVIPVIWNVDPKLEQ